MMLSAKIMNIPERVDLDRAGMYFYSVGHRDARHAAAELALAADACIDALRDLDERLRSCIGLPITAAEAYDSFYQEIVSEALSAAGVIHA